MLLLNTMNALAIPEGFEPPPNGFGDRYATVTPENR